MRKAFIRFFRKLCSELHNQLRFTSASGGQDGDGDEVSSAIIQETGPTLGTKQEDILNIILAHKDHGISQTQILSRLSDEGKTSFQSNVSRDLAKLDEKKCIQKLNNSYFPIARTQ